MLLQQENVELPGGRFGSLLVKCGEGADLSVALYRLAVLCGGPCQKRSRQTVVAIVFFDRLQERYRVGPVSRPERSFRRPLRHRVLCLSVLG